MINEGTIFLLARPQVLLGLFAPRNVLNHSLKLPGIVSFLKQAADPILVPHFGAVSRVEAMIKREHRLIGRQ